MLDENEDENNQRQGGDLKERIPHDESRCNAGISLFRINMCHLRRSHIHLPWEAVS